MRYTKEDIDDLIDHLRSFKEGIYVEKYAWLLNEFLEARDRGVFEDGLSERGSICSIAFLIILKDYFSDVWRALMVIPDEELPLYVGDGPSTLLERPIAEWRLRRGG